MEDVRVSLVIPTFNRGELLIRALDAVCAQSRPPDEIVVVDDGSEDDTAVLLAAHPAQVRYIYQPNAGAAAARNHGARAASCEWIAFLDSDDYWQADYLAKMIAAVQKTGGRADLYFADTIFSAERNGRRAWPSANYSIRAEYELVADGAALVMSHLPLPMMLQSSLFKRQTFLAMGGLWEQLRSREDTHFFFRIGLSGVLCAVNTVGATMTNDDAANRLTAVHRRRAPHGYQMQVMMYQNLLQTSPDLSPAYRDIFRRRLAEAYLSLARLAARHRQGRLVAKYAARSLQTAPGALWRSARHKLSPRR